MAEKTTKKSSKKETKPKTTKATEVKKEVTETKSEKSTEKKCNKGLIIGCIAAAVVAIVAAIIVFAVIKPFNKVNMIGKYELTGLTTDGEDQSSSLSLMKAFGISAEVEITDDKNGKMNIYGEEIDFTYDDKQFHFKVDEDDEDAEVKKDTNYTYKDEKITMKSNDSEMIFSKKKD